MYLFTFNFRKCKKGDLGYRMPKIRHPSLMNKQPNRWEKRRRRFHLLFNKTELKNFIFRPDITWWNSERFSDHCWQLQASKCSLICQIFRYIFNLLLFDTVARLLDVTALHWALCQASFVKFPLVITKHLVITSNTYLYLYL
jgi:hypothetical protein